MKRKFYQKAYRFFGRLEEWFWNKWADTYPQNEHTYADDEEPA